LLLLLLLLLLLCPGRHANVAGQPCRFAPAS
jgi:hypothetical protein